MMRAPEEPPLHGHQEVEEISDVIVVPGWTLYEKDRWYKTVTGQLESILDVNTCIVQGVPTPDNPNPEAWRAALNEAVLRPCASLVVTHSLGTVTALQWATKRAQADPAFRLGGLAIVSGNVTDVGFDEITSHFPQLETIIADTLYLSNRIRYQPELFYGMHDPFVGVEHGLLLAHLLHGNLNIMPDEGHFSGSVINPAEKVFIPPCEDRRPTQAEAAASLAEIYNSTQIDGSTKLDPEHFRRQALNRHIPRQYLPGHAITQRVGAIILCSRASAKETLK